MLKTVPQKNDFDSALSSAFDKFFTDTELLSKKIG